MRVGISVISLGQECTGQWTGQHVMLLARMSRHVPWAQSRLLNEAGVSHPYAPRLTRRCRDTEFAERTRLTDTTTRRRRCAHLRAEMLSHVCEHKYYLFEGRTIRSRNVRCHFPVGARATAIDAGWLDSLVRQPFRSPVGFSEEEAMSRAR